ncbi:rod shape-determining protein MreC [Candidatus Parcubacteria bacterium]|uniref:Rod shape-determining protein MreC beta-barrel core domain-containing protein n=1 Tax=Candidatus Kaiserbacteria bacterium CG10_big_fil_rev_8_21_14_0_10_47_16 TaxID=1974608 RepID=A0A2H0UD34_9BACT|nr:rod shape-determining protein MreC [Candidatus Parcubacteria bacterium]PIR84334.1 MAG: hypothetical protein COU16_01935 [Candidatus Kaiserbacteria bacterium CG10_big_fil_rev_8_21_14_0_10_47_16]
MRDYSLKKKENFRRGYKHPLARAAIIVVVALLLVYVFGGLIGGATAVLVKPWYAATSWMHDGTGIIPTYLRSAQSYRDEVTRLSDELAQAHLNDEERQFLESENTELRALLGDTEGATHERIAAGVIGRPPFIPYDTLMLDRGTDDGILLDAPVYHFNNQLIGFVSSVSGHSAVVTLLSAPNFETTVYVFGPNIYTTARGVGNGVVRVSVPQNIAIAEGDSVVAPTLEQGFIGRFGVIRSESSEPEQYGFVLPDNSIQSFRLVSVGVRPVTEVSFDAAKNNLESAKSSLFTIPVPADVLVDEHATSTDPVDTTGEEASTTAE